MTIITIDNMYEQDGVAQLELFFMSQFPGAPPQMRQGRLLAIVPEYGDPGHMMDASISKVHLLLASEPAVANPTPEQLVPLTAEINAAALARIVTAYMNAQREAAEAKLGEPAVEQLPDAKP